MSAIIEKNTVQVWEPFPVKSVYSRGGSWQATDLPNASGPLEAAGCHGFPPSPMTSVQLEGLSGPLITRLYSADLPEQVRTAGRGGAMWK